MKLLAVFLIVIGFAASAADAQENSQLISKLLKSPCAPQAAETNAQKSARIKTELEFYRFMQQKRSQPGQSFDPNASCETPSSCQVLAAGLKSALTLQEAAISSWVSFIEQQNELLELKNGGKVPATVLTALKQNRASFESDLKYYQQRAKSYQDLIAQLMAKPPGQLTPYDESDISNYTKYFAETDLIASEYQELLTWLDNGAVGWLANNRFFNQYLGMAAPDSITATQNSIIEAQNKIEFYNKRLKEVQARSESMAAQSSPAQIDEMAYKEFENGTNWVLNSVKSRQGYQQCGLSMAELYALYDYTGSGYSTLNRSLRSGSTEYKVYLVVLNNALKKLAPFRENHLVHRGASFSPEVKAKLIPGKYLDYVAPVSTGLFSAFGGEVQMEIKSKNGRFVELFSAVPHEHEVLFPAPTRFKIIKRIEKGDGRILLKLEEVGPTETASAKSPRRGSKKAARRSHR